MGEGQQAANSEVVVQPEPVTAETVLAKLKPRQTEAAEGSLHTIYTFANKEGKPVEVLFYSPNELPLIEAEAVGKQVVINGDDPEFRSKSDWEDFTLKILKASANAEASQDRKILFVEAGPEALLETVSQLGLELTSSQNEALAQIEEKKLTDTGLRVLDDVIAGNLIDDKGNLRSDSQHEGEALYLLALAGDEQAKQVLKAKGEALRKLDEQREMEEKKEYSKRRQEDESSERKSLEVKDLVAVHATKFLPEKGSDGSEIQTTFEASGWQAPRDTIHFALNHEVASHMYGSWEDAGYVLISPLEEMMKINGKPTVLNTVDTFWEVGPGKRLKLPESTAIVQAGNLPQGEVITGIETSDIRYKATDFDPQDITALLKELNDKDKDSLSDEVVDLITRSFSNYPIGNEISLEEKQIERWVEITGPYAPYKIKVLQDLQEHSVEEVVKYVLNLGEVRVTDEQLEMISTKIRSSLKALIKRLAVEKKIEQMGYKVQPGGMWAWGGSWDVTAETWSLGAKLEVPVMAHTSHINGRVEEAAKRGLDVLLDDESTPSVNERVKMFEKTKRRIREDLVLEASQDTRRMLYLTGLI